jgi:hypothetical protein
MTAEPTTELLALVIYSSSTDRKKGSSIIACSLFDWEASLLFSCCSVACLNSCYLAMGLHVTLIRVIYVMLLILWLWQKAKHAKNKYISRKQRLCSSLKSKFCGILFASITYCEFHNAKVTFSLLSLFSKEEEYGILMLSERVILYLSYFLKEEAYVFLLVFLLLPFHVPF